MKNFHERLPNTLIIGAAKAGTTTLYDLLKQHPQVFLSFDKEPRFFSHEEYFNRGTKWYVETYFDQRETYPVQCEATPHYLYWADKVSPRIKQAYQTKPLKFIVILRNPIDRAYSWYWNMVIDGRESLPFLAALKAEEKRIKGNWAELEYTGSMLYGYVKGGCYAAQIQQFFEDFPEDRFHILLLDDLLQDQTGAMHKLTHFLGIDSETIIKPSLSNPSQRPRNRLLHKLVREQFRLKELTKSLIPIRIRHAIKSFILKSNLKDFAYPEMESEAYFYLKDKLSPEISQLSGIIQRDLSSWLNQ
jgi:hypothetical protein